MNDHPYHLIGEVEYVRFPTDLFRKTLHCSPEARFAAVLMAEHISDSGGVSSALSEEVIREKLDVGREKTRRIINELKEAGVLEINQQRGRDGRVAGSIWSLNVEGI